MSHRIHRFHRFAARVSLGITIIIASLCGRLGLAFFQPADSNQTSEEKPMNLIGKRMLDIDGHLHRIGLDSGLSASVIVLLDPGCPIANRYAPELNTLAERARERGVVFYGVISDPMVNPSEARAFRDERKLQYPLLFDAIGDLALRLQPTHVPQAFIIDKQDRIRYRGRIDNRFVSVGRLRQQITNHDLRDAIDAVAKGQDVAARETPAIGCVFEAWNDDLPEEITYTQHVQPILEANCIDCHSQGGIATFRLDSFEHAARRARMIAFVSEDQLMPPLSSDPAFRRFRDDRTLSEREIAILKKWAQTGKTRGDQTDALPARQITSGWSLGEPDAVVTMEEPYELPATGPDQYRRFVMKSPFTEPTTLVAIDFKPGDPQVVHHVNMFFDPDGEARRRDAEDEAPGYDAFGKAGGMQNTYEWDTEGFGIGGWAPGSQGYRLPEGVGMYLPANGDIVIEIHYHLSGKATSDRSSVAFYVAKKPVEKYVDGLLMGSLDLTIEAGDEDYLRHIYMDVPVDMELVDLFPHMHYLGTEMWAQATTADQDVIPLIRIKDWDFRWQGFYQYMEPIKIPAGSRIDAWFRYDNSAENPDNPTIPPKDVKWGWQSTDEMLEIWMTTIYTNPSDSARLQNAALSSFYRGADPKSDPPASEATD